MVWETTKIVYKVVGCLLVLVGLLGCWFVGWYVIIGDEIRETTISLNAKNHPRKTLATTHTLREDQAQFVPLNSSFSKILGAQLTRYDDRIIFGRLGKQQTNMAKTHKA